MLENRAAELIYPLFLLSSVDAGCNNFVHAAFDFSLIARSGGCTRSAGADDVKRQHTTKR